MVKPVVDAVGNRPVGEDRGETAAASFDKGIGPADVEKTVVLACKARACYIFGRCRAAYCYRYIVLVLCLQLAVGLGNQLPKIVAGGPFEYDLARRAAQSARASICCLSKPTRSSCRRSPAWAAVS